MSFDPAKRQFLEEQAVILGEITDLKKFRSAMKKQPVAPRHKTTTPPSRSLVASPTPVVTLTPHRKHSDSKVTSPTFRSPLPSTIKKTNAKKNKARSNSKHTSSTSSNVASPLNPNTYASPKLEGMTMMIPQCKYCSIDLHIVGEASGYFPVGWHCENENNCGGNYTSGGFDWAPRWSCVECQSDLCFRCVPPPNMENLDNKYGTYKPLPQTFEDAIQEIVELRQSKRKLNSEYTEGYKREQEVKYIRLNETYKATRKQLKQALITQDEHTKQIQKYEKVIKYLVLKNFINRWRNRRLLKRGLEQFEKLRGVVTETQVRFEGVEYGYLDPTRERSHPSHPDNPNNLSNPNNPDYQERIHDLNQDSIIGFLPSPKKHSTDLNNANSRSQSNSPTQSHSSSPLKHTSNNPGKTLAESKESNQKKTKKIVTPYSLDRLVIVLFNYAFYFIKDIPVLLNNLLNSVNSFVSRSVATALEQKEDQAVISQLKECLVDSVSVAQEHLDEEQIKAFKKHRRRSNSRSRSPHSFRARRYHSSSSGSRPRSLVSTYNRSPHSPPRPRSRSPTSPRHALRVGGGYEFEFDAAKRTDQDRRKSEGGGDRFPLDLSSDHVISHARGGGSAAQARPRSAGAGRAQEQGAFGVVSPWKGSRRAVEAREGRVFASTSGRKKKKQSSVDRGILISNRSGGSSNPSRPGGRAWRQQQAHILEQAFLAARNPGLRTEVLAENHVHFTEPRTTTVGASAIRDISSNQPQSRGRTVPHLAASGKSKKKKGTRRVPLTLDDFYKDGARFVSFKPESSSSESEPEPQPQPEVKPDKRGYNFLLKGGKTSVNKPIIPVSKLSKHEKTSRSNKSRSTPSSSVFSFSASSTTKQAASKKSNKNKNHSIQKSYLGFWDKYGQTIEPNENEVDVSFAKMGSETKKDLPQDLVMMAVKQQIEKAKGIRVPEPPVENFRHGSFWQEKGLTPRQKSGRRNSKSRQGR